MLTSNGLHPIQKLIFKSPWLFPSCSECLNTPVLRSKGSERGRQNFALSYPGRARLCFLSFLLLFCLVQKFSFGFFRPSLHSSLFLCYSGPNVHPGSLTLPDKSENGVRVGICSWGVLGRFIVALGKGETGPKLRPLALPSSLLPLFSSSTFACLDYDMKGTIGGFDLLFLEML